MVDDRIWGRYTSKKKERAVPIDKADGDRLLIFQLEKNLVQ